MPDDGVRRRPTGAEIEVLVNRHLREGKYPEGQESAHLPNPFLVAHDADLVEIDLRRVVVLEGRQDQPEALAKAQLEGPVRLGFLVECGDDVTVALALATPVDLERHQDQRREMRALGSVVLIPFEEPEGREQGRDAHLANAGARSLA